MQDNYFRNDDHSLLDLGYKINFDKYKFNHGLDSFETGRVIAVHKDRYEVHNGQVILSAEIIGNLRYASTSPSDLPATGDWVAIAVFDHQQAYIHAVYERDNQLTRRSAGQSNDEQIIAANINFGLILQSVNRDFNLNRLDRYLTVCYEAGIVPIVVLTKIDLIDAAMQQQLITSVHERHPDLKVLPLSTLSNEGIEAFESLLLPRHTYCLMGSSGVGKSSLINRLLDEQKMKTRAIGSSTERGKHATTHRELIKLPNGSLIIDTPGMRELGLIDMSHGIDQAFGILSDFSVNCKYKDCKHINEANCAVLKAVEQGEIDADLYDNYVKLVREDEFHTTSSAEHKRKAKILAKRIKNIQRLKGK